MASTEGVDDRPHQDLRQRRDQDDRGSAVRPPVKRVKASVHACINGVNGSVAPAAPVAPVGGLSSALAASIWPSPAALRTSRSSRRFHQTIVVRY